MRSRLGSQTVSTRRKLRIRRLWTVPILGVMLLCGCSGTGSPAPEKEAASTPSSGGTAPVVEEPGAPTIGTDASFWQTWGDGQAELSSYALRIPRYGALRSGTAVAIFVTENFSLSKRVKTDAAPTPGGDAFPVMKLNLAEDFQTGIYDYNVMTSTFVALQPVDGRAAGRATKVSFSSQEWCGHVYHQLLFGQYGAKSTLHSYFEGEADEEKDIAAPRDGISEDVLMHWVRGMALPILKPGETRAVSLLPSLQSSRFQHQALGWREAKLSRSETSEPLTVPAGVFDVETFRVQIQGGATRTYFVEKAAPHRIVKWMADDGESAEMLRSIRSKYWQENDPAGESKLSELGLNPRPPHTM